MKAMILAAGFGTRLKPFTEHHPKALAPVNGKSLLEINIRNLQKFGIKDIVVNVHHFAEQIEEAINFNKGFGSNVVVSDERDEVLETGGGLKRAAHLLRDSEDILVMNVDILSDFDFNRMYLQHKRSRALATLAVQNRNSSRYFLFQEEDKHLSLCGWRHAGSLEERIPCPPAGSLIPRAFSGIQIIQSSFLNKITQNGKFSIVDVYLSMCCQEKIYAWDHTGDLLLDVGKPESLDRAATMFHW
jgi:MurNAc alpha-1-phosphate uridylyltransferase